MATSSGTPAENPSRELAAIMFSDIAGYTALMGRDEQEAIRAIDAHRALLRDMLPRFNGRILGEVGDGTLSSFHSAVDAVNCAREVQGVLTEDPELRLRIGIHVGDVVFTEKTALGDGVNIASRIHALAAPAVSASRSGSTTRFGTSRSCRWNISARRRSRT
jgi:adenylate cyclase